MGGWFFLLALALGGLGLWLVVRSGANRRATGLPRGRVTYVDTGAWDRCERPMFSQRYRLTGRPDYVVQTRRGVVPVEVKSGVAPQAPYEAHVMQLAAYCLLVEEQEGQAPPYGIVSYTGKAFEIDYTPDLRRELVATLEAMRHDLQARRADRDHKDAGRCHGCGYRQHCDQRLA